MKKQLLLLAMILPPLVASAHDIEVKNADGVTIYYNYINNGTELEVTFCGSSDNDYSNEYQGNVAIPEEVTYMNRTRKVTSIGSNAFRQCSGLTSITIPNSVTSIGNEAFRECSGLTSITIPNSVTSIGGAAFYKCSGLKKVIVKDIAAWCRILFLRHEYVIEGGYSSNPLLYAHHLYSDENTEITNLTIPNSVTSIGEWAFYKCSGLTSVNIPNSVTSIGNYAFADCSGLTSVTIGSGVTSIGDAAFHDCSGLTSITIPNSVTSIGGIAFFGCSGLTSITIGSGVTSIGYVAFDGVDIPTIISLIENPFTITGKTSDFRTFTQNTFNNATLYVPKGTIDKYKATDGWKDFLFIEEGTGGGATPTTQKCEKPTISYVDGEIVFGCETEGVDYVSEIKASDANKYYDQKIVLTNKYIVSVYATKTGYENSEVVTAEIVIEGGGMKGDVNGDGEVGIGDIITITNIMAE